MKLVAYNIQFGTGKDGRVDLDRIADEIANADVIAMQEVDRYWKRSEMADQVSARRQRLQRCASGLAQSGGESSTLGFG